jgi:TRAP-type C4-dicarboxylate transport system permease small subunit
MTKKDILAVALKIMGVFFLWVFFVTLPVFVVSFSSIKTMHSLAPDVPEFFILMSLILYYLLMLLFAIVFLKFSDVIAKKLVTEDSSAISPGTGIDSKGFFSLSLKIIGVLMLTQAFPMLAKKLLGTVTNSGFHIFTYAGLEIFYEVVRLLLGLGLIFHDKPLSISLKNKSKVS